MAPAGDEKVVRTTLNKREYERFRRVAESEGITVETALRCAVREYVDQRRTVEDDPLFERIESFDDAVGEVTDAREYGADLYE